MDMRKGVGNITMDYDFELEKHYHPENFMTEEELEEELAEQERVIAYNTEVTAIILEGIKL